MSFSFEILDSNGEKESVVDFSSITFTESLNGNPTFYIRIPNSSSYKFSKYVEYQKLNASGNEQGLFYATNSSGFLEHKGKIDDIDTDDSGNLVLQGRGTIDFCNNITLYDQDRGSETNVVRGSFILGEVATYYNYTGGTADAFSGNPLSAVYYEGIPALQALDEMVVLECDQDYYTIYNSTVGGNDTFQIRDRAGSSAIVQEFVEGVNARNIKVKRSNRGIVNHVRVIGAVVNGTQVTATVEDATSISLYGRREQVVVNKKLENTTAATDFGNSIIANRKDPRTFVDFEVTNITFDFEDPDNTRGVGKLGLGDAISLTSINNDLSEQSLRILGYSREFFPDNTEKLYIQCISDAVRYSRGSSNTGSNNRDGTTSATPGQNLTQGTHTPGQNLTQTNHTPGQNLTQSNHTPGQNFTQTADGGGARAGDANSNVGVVSCTGGTWKDIATHTISTNWTWGVVYVGIEGTGTNSQADVRVRRDTGGGYITYPSTSGVTIPINTNGPNVAVVPVANSLNDSGNLLIQMKVTTTASPLVNYGSQVFGTHSHAVTDKTNQATSATFTDSTNQSTSATFTDSSNQATTANITDSSNQATTHEGSSA